LADVRPDDTLLDPPRRERLAAIPKRFVPSSYDPEFPRARMNELFGTAVERYEAAVKAGEFQGTFDDWQAHHADRGYDAISGRPLPVDWSRVAKWPRFTDVGWERGLTFNWHGSIPWGKDGYWIAEDLIADEMMVVYPSDLGRDEFSDITLGQWETWWRAREVDPRAEMPDGTRLPMSRRARLLLGADAPPPRTKKEWYKLQEARERDGTKLPNIEKVTSPEQTLRPSVWQKLMRVAFGGKPDEGDRKKV
jgi:hypothetical protein